MLQSDFVVGWTNIRKSDYVGYSHGYHSKQTSVGTTNGAGPRNTQMFVLSPDLVVLHALPGFWHPEDLESELRFAKVVGKLWGDQSKSLEAKQKIYTRLHRREVFAQSPETFSRSQWQSFDSFTEWQRVENGEKRDTVLRNADGSPVLDGQNGYRMKPINVLVHERMARRPFVAWSEFDIEDFVDYGKLHYDLNQFEKTRKKFKGQTKLMKKRAKLARN